MASEISNYLEPKLLSHVLRNVSFTPPVSVYVSLHTADPGGTGASEVAGGSYARQAATFGAPTGSQPATTATTGALTYTGMPAATVTHVAIWDASSAGNALWAGALNASKVVGAGDTFTIAIADLSVTLT